MGDRLNLVQIDADGKIRTGDVRKALEIIAHAPDPAVIDDIVAKLDVDQDGFVRRASPTELTMQVPLSDILALAGKEGLGVTLDKQADDLVAEGRELRAGGRSGPTARPGQ